MQQWPGGFFHSDWPAQYSAICLPFTHDAAGDPEVAAATLIYELKLHHYVLHLQRSGSPYAFHALGSSCALNSAAYAACEAFRSGVRERTFISLTNWRRWGQYILPEAAG